MLLLHSTRLLLRLPLLLLPLKATGDGSAGLTERWASLLYTNALIVSHSDAPYSPDTETQDIDRYVARLSTYIQPFNQSSIYSLFISSSQFHACLHPRRPHVPPSIRPLPGATRPFSSPSAPSPFLCTHTAARLPEPEPSPPTLFDSSPLQFLFSSLALSPQPRSGP